MITVECALTEVVCCNFEVAYCVTYRLIIVNRFTTQKHVFAVKALRLKIVRAMRSVENLKSLSSGSSS